jgi:uncharacterized SAM-binding protein YcdF (DUF218 family)
VLFVLLVVPSPGGAFVFFFKKLVGPLLFPHSVLLALLGAGVLILWLGSRQRLGRKLVTIAAAGFFMLSYPVMWGGVMDWMDGNYPPLNLDQADLKGVDWVVVLGGGGASSSILPATAQLSAPSLARLVEGIRIHKALPEAKLLVSGGPGLRKYSDALTMQEAARILGVDPQKIVVEGKARDTEEEAVEIKGFVGNDRFVMITSAVHMPRAMALFAKQGMSPIAAPTDFYFGKGNNLSILDLILPTSAGAARIDAVFREFLGTTWSRLRGRI